MSIVPLTASRKPLLLLALLAVGAAYAPGAAANLRLATGLDAVSGVGSPWLRAPALELRSADSVRESLVLSALESGSAMLGTRYELGADRDDAVDCSALVRRMFVSIGKPLPRTARAQMAVGTAVPPARIQAGDLLFYRFGRHGLHVAVYVAEGRVLHASRNAQQVALSTLDAAWRRRFVAARRVF